MDDQSMERSYDPSLPPLRKGRRSRRLVLMLFLFILAIGGIVGATNYFGSREKAEREIAPTTLPEKENEIEFIIETPTPTADEEPEETSTPTPKPSINPIDQETGLDRSTLSIEVLNGSGETGAASKASEVLKAFGYSIVSIGNADNTDYENVTIKVKSDKEKFLDLLKKDLGFSYTIGTSSAELSASASADALVVVGK